MAPARTRLRPRVRPRYKGPSFNRLIPNILTLVGLCAGLTGLRFALDGAFGPAAVAIVVAGGIDGLDGRIARLLKVTSRFGAEFDSLTDFFCFGVAPAFAVFSALLAFAFVLFFADVAAAFFAAGFRVDFVCFGIPRSLESPGAVAP